MKKETIKAVLIDDDLRALNRMKILLQHFPEIDIVEQTTDAEYGIKFVTSQQPDLVFLDVEMPQKTGLEVADEINKFQLHTKIVFVTSHNHYAIEAIKQSAFDYLLKPVSIDTLKQCILRYTASFKSNLNKRELEIVRLIAKGFNSKEIGEQLFISRHTVDTYRRKILEKTSCKNSAELVQYVAKNGLI